MRSGSGLRSISHTPQRRTKPVPLGKPVSRRKETSKEHHISIGKLSVLGDNAVHESMIHSRRKALGIGCEHCSAGTEFPIIDCEIRVSSIVTEVSPTRLQMVRDKEFVIEEQVYDQGISAREVLERVNTAGSDMPRYHLNVLEFQAVAWWLNERRASFLSTKIKYPIGIPIFFDGATEIVMFTWCADSTKSGWKIACARASQLRSCVELGWIVAFAKQ